MSHRALIAILFALFGSLQGQDRLKEIFEKLKQAYRSESDSAQHYATLLLRGADKAKSAHFAIRAREYEGRILLRNNKVKEAFDVYFDALRRSRDLNETEAEERILDEIATLYFEQKNYTEAKRYFQLQIASKMRTGDSLRLANTLLNISMLTRRSEGFDSAAVLLKRVQHIAYSLREPALLAQFYNSMANHYFAMFVEKNNINAYGNDPNLWKRKFVYTAIRDSAAFYWQKAYDIWKERQDLEKAIQPLFNLGYYYHTRKEHARALHHYLSALSIADSMKLGARSISLYGNLAELYYDMGSFRPASDYFRKYLESKDSVQKAELKEYAVKLDRKFQLESKNKTILQQELEIARKNELISRQEKRLYLFLFLSISGLFLVLAAAVYVRFNRRLSQKLDEAKEKFLTNVMHEIRTPLSMIQGPLSTLRPRLKDEESLYYVQLAERNIQRLSELIGQMLDVSKLQRAAYRLNETIGQPGLLFRDVAAAYENLAAEKNLAFVTDIQCGDALVRFDRDALEKIVSNLLSNAVKYTGEGGSAGLRAQLEEGEEYSAMTVEVWDTGIGISAQDQRKLFDRFFRSETTAVKVPGIGIGLSLVKDLVDACGGRIQIESEPGKGTRCTVSLRFANATAAVTQRGSETAQPDLPLVLFIEDDADIQEFVSGFLQSRNLNVIRAGNGKQAEALLKNILPDIILTDLMMDELDGLSLLRFLKADKGLDHIPVIVLSAKSAAHTRIELLNAGAQAYLSKPFIPEELFSVISNQLNLVTKVKNEFISKVRAPQQQVTAEQKFSSMEPYTQKFFDLVFRQLDDTELSVELLADQMSTNRSHFQRKLKSLTGYSPSELIKMIRLEKSHEYLLQRKGNVTEVAYMCGFSSQSYFTKCFTRHFGFSPSQLSAQQGA